MLDSLSLCYFFLLPPRQPRSTLFPYTTLFRSRPEQPEHEIEVVGRFHRRRRQPAAACDLLAEAAREMPATIDRKSTRLNSSHTVISYAVFCLKKKKKI